jgi:hypothetical protein
MKNQVAYKDLVKIKCDYTHQLPVWETIHQASRATRMNEEDRGMASERGGGGGG